MDKSYKHDIAQKKTNMKAYIHKYAFIYRKLKNGQN